MTGTIENQKTDGVNQSIEYPMNILDFQKMFPDEAACLKYLERTRWPKGFICSKCATVGEPFRIPKRLHVLKCRTCHYETSITAGTVMHRSKLLFSCGFGLLISFQHRPLAYRQSSFRKN